MDMRRLHLSATLQPNGTDVAYDSERGSPLRLTQEILKKLVVTPPLGANNAKFINKVKKIAAATRAAQRREKHWAKQTALNHINAHLKCIATGLENAIEKEAKENGSGALTYQILHPETNWGMSNGFPQLPNNARAVIFEDDIRNTPAFAELTEKCTKLGVKLDLVEQWSNIAWNPYLGGNAAFVWQLTIYGW